MDSLKNISKELLKALRGEKSRNWVSLRLGFDYNVVSRWESGRRKINWEEFIALAKLLKVDCTQLWQILFKGEHVAPKRIFEKLIKSKDPKIVGSLLNCSRSKVYRLSSGIQIPSLEEVLLLINYHGDLIRFIGHLVNDLALIPSLQQEILRSKKARQFF